MKLKHLALVAGAFALAFAAMPVISFAQDSVADQLIGAACADDGAVVRWLAGIFGASAAASLIANFRGKLPAIAVRILDLVALNLVAALRQSATAAKKTAPVLVLGGLALGGLSACAAVDAAKTGQPLDHAAMQRDLASAVYLLQATGCAVAGAGAAATPIVSISADAEGQQVLQAVDAAGAIVCKLVVPPTALPVPAPANAAPATAPAAAS